MIRPLHTALCVLFFLLPASLAADPPPGFRYNVVFYISDSCCGGSGGFNGVRPGECIYVGASRPGGYGTTIAMSGYRYDSEGVPLPGGPPDPLLYGYGIGWNGTNCTNKAFEIRTRGCYKAEDTSGSIRSFSFVLDPNMPSERTRVQGAVPAYGEKETEGVSAVTPQASPCRGADWFEYVDHDTGRGRRIALNGSEQLMESVTQLYNEGKFAELRDMER